MAHHGQALIRPCTTTVTLSSDWSAVPDDIRGHIGFPPFPAEHLANSLAHLAELSQEAAYA